MARLAAIVRRGVHHQNQLGTRIRRVGGGLGLPDVLADEHADAHALDDEDPGGFAMLEIALLVEDRVVGQRLLVVRPLELALADQRRRVVDLAPRIRVAHDRRDAFDLRSQCRQLAAAGFEEARALKQVFRRIAGQGQLGEGDQ